MGVVLAAFAVAAAACTGDEGGGGTTGGGPNAEPDTFTYSVNSEVMIGWDPATGYSNEVIALHNIYETLTRYNARPRRSNRSSPSRGTRRRTASPGRSRSATA